MSVTYPRGFRAAGVTAGLKASGRRDLGLLVADAPAAVAGAFTTNAFPAAPVEVTRSRLRAGRARALVVNSGQANAGTGEPGLRDAEATAAAAGSALGLVPDQVLVGSTGVIGARVPVPLIAGALPGAVTALSTDGGQAFAEAICTTDTRPKQAAAEAGGYRVGGCAKGAGMIGPRLAPHGLATLLAYLTTDAPASPAAVRAIVAERVAPTWNALVVDGCQSTNDTVLLLAGGAAGGPGIDPGSAAAAALADAVESVCRDLARQVAADAEGASTTLVVQVDGASTDEDARELGVAVAGSPLVKTAVFGGDPNPGRILQAAGDGGVALESARFRASMGGIPVIEGGVVLEDGDAAAPALAEREVLIELHVGEGKGAATVFGCDLSPEYVRINAEYRT